MTARRLIHIVDDEAAIRRSVGFMLKTSGYAVETWESGTAFLNEVRHAEHGCILLDVRMPEIDGLDVQQRLAARGVTMPIVIMTGHGDISIAVSAMKAGGDFLEKPFEKATLLGAIEAAFDRIPASGGASTRAAAAEVLLATLTDSERDILQALARGLPNKNIAVEHSTSTHMVEVHRANLMTKLGVQSLSDALRIAFAAGMGG